MIKVCFFHAFFQRLLVIDQPNIHPVADVFHRLAKDAVVHEFEKIFLKLVLHLGTKVRIQLNVWFQPCLDNNACSQEASNQFLFVF